MKGPAEGKLGKWLLIQGSERQKRTGSSEAGGMVVRLLPSVERDKLRALITMFSPSVLIDVINKIKNSVLCSSQGKL